MKRIIMILCIAVFSVWFANGAWAQGFAIQFIGDASQHVEAKDSDSLDINGKEFTMEAWVYPTELGADLIIVNKESSYEMAIGQGVLRYAIMAPTWAWWGQGVVPLNEWSHVAVTYDGTETVGWINGAKANSVKDNNGNIVPSGDPFNIGWRPWDTNFPFIGIIDEVRISKTVRYTQEFDVPETTFASDENTVALYHLDEGDGDSTEDDSGEGNHAELIGDPEWVESTAPFAALEVNPGGKLTALWGAVKQRE